MAIGFGSQDPSGGRFQGRHVLYGFNIDLTSGTGNLGIIVPCPYNNAEIINYGYSMPNAPGSPSVLAVTNLRTQKASTAVVTSYAPLSALTFNPALGQFGVQVADLDPSQAYTPLAGPPGRPVISLGDYIIFYVTTAGVGGNQTVNAFVTIRERP